MRQNGKDGDTQLKYKTEQVLSESAFVEKFASPARKERLLHELTDPRKRYRGLDRFCHQTGELIARDNILLQGKDLAQQSAFRRFVERHDAECAIFSPDPIWTACVCR